MKTKSPTYKQLSVTLDVLYRIYMINLRKRADGAETSKCDLNALNLTLTLIERLRDESLAPKHP